MDTAHARDEICVRNTLTWPIMYRKPEVVASATGYVVSAASSKLAGRVMNAKNPRKPMATSSKTHRDMGKIEHTRALAHTERRDR